MSTAASLPSVVKPRFIEPVGESQTSEGDYERERHATIISLSFGTLNICSKKQDLLSNLSKQFIISLRGSIQQFIKLTTEMGTSCFYLIQNCFVSTQFSSLVMLK
jgi:hypothetical protein